MIIDRLANWRLYANVNPLFQKAFEFLENSDLSGMECGRYDIAGDDAYAMIQEPEGKTEATAKVEVHRKYIDIQFVVSGNEKMGWIPLCGMGHDEGFDEKKDCGFFKDK
ncbi:MAG: YhcH/YjgK/YiaL family protein, partial [Victivallales bacterium]|nr:YhcH/YjgK/YiaL family protein [Victivallales bacterium]